MIRHRYSRLIDALCISVLLGASISSCSEQEETVVSPSLSDTEITFSLSEWTPIEQSRAVFFDPADEGAADYLNPQQGGGNFTLYAYYVKDGTGYKEYINNKRGWYFKARNVWWMLDEKSHGVYEHREYYWPNSGKLDFFAYMPNVNYNGDDVDGDGIAYRSEPTHVTIGSYSPTAGQTFSCALPAVAGDDTPIQDFTYAYETGKTKTNDPVMLNFKHPFALINFKLGAGSYRMSIDEITFGKKEADGTVSDGIYLNGTCSVNKTSTGTETCTWTPAGSREIYTAKIQKDVPGIEDDANGYEDKNYDTNLSNWFIVMPQNLAGVKLTLRCKRGDGGTTLQESKEFTFSAGTWEPGHKYIYTITYGDKNEEIYFNVSDEVWNGVNYGDGDGDGNDDGGQNINVE